MFSFKEIIGDVRSSVVSMLTTGAILFVASIGGAIWKSVRQQPLPWTVVIGIGIIGIVLFAIAITMLRRTTNKNLGFIQPKRDPQPIIVAVDELKSLLNEGETLVGRFQEDSVKPTLGEVEHWRQRMRDCARQKVLATENLVGAKDLLRLDKEWDEEEVLSATAKFVDHGCFTDGSTHMAVFQHLWGHVQRLKELIAKIEGEEATPQTNSFPTKSAATSQTDKERTNPAILIKFIDRLRHSEYPRIAPEMARSGVAVVLPQLPKVDPIGALIELSHEFKAEDEVASLCKELSDTAYGDPFSPLEVVYGAGVFDSKRLKFICDARNFNHPIETNEHALHYLGSFWAERNGLPQKPYDARARFYPPNPRY